MITLMSSIWSWLNEIFQTVLNLTFPSGNGGTIHYKSVVLFVFLSSLAFSAISWFLVKGFRLIKSGYWTEKGSSGRTK